jgi:hypothetical protein
MTDLDMTRLSFLFDAILSAPEDTDAFIERIHRSEPSDELKRAVAEFCKTFETFPPVQGQEHDRLKKTALRLMKREDRAVQVTGMVLAKAIEISRPARCG